MIASKLSAIVSAPKDVRELADVWPLVHLFRLPVGATILVAGAYRGRVMELLARAYDYERLIGFEPQAEHAYYAKTRVSHLGAEIELYGLGIENAILPMGEYGAEFSSFVNTDPQYSRHKKDIALGYGEVRNALEVFRELDLPKIDLLLLNMEGYEFILVPFLLKHGLFSTGYIDRLAVQIHWGLGYDHVFEPMAKELERTHKRVFDESPSWIYWQYSG